MGDFWASLGGIAAILWGLGWVLTINSEMMLVFLSCSEIPLPRLIFLGVLDNYLDNYLEITWRLVSLVK